MMFDNHKKTDWKINLVFRLVVAWLADVKDVLTMRVVCVQWNDIIQGLKLKHLTATAFSDEDVKLWRACFPSAVNVRVLGITDDCFKYLAGIHTLYMSDTKITDAAFVHLSGIHTLDISYCYKLSNNAFKHLSGIHTLNMSNRYVGMFAESQMTDAVFKHLSGIHTLDISYCDNISDDAFKHLSGIHTLIMKYCTTIFYPRSI